MVFLHRPHCMTSKRGKRQVCASHSIFIHSPTLSPDTSIPSVLSQKTFYLKAVWKVFSSLEPCPFIGLLVQSWVHCFFLGNLTTCNTSPLLHQISASQSSQLTRPAWGMRNPVRFSPYECIHYLKWVMLKCSKWNALRGLTSTVSPVDTYAHLSWKPQTA